MAASASMSSSDPDIHARMRQHYDDDVIGLSEHVNKHEHIPVRKEVDKCENTPKRLPDKQPKDDVKPEEKKEQPVTQAFVQMVQPDIMKDDFPALPGAPVVPAFPKANDQTKNEAFPALGKPMNSGIVEHSTNTRTKQNWANQVNGIPIKAKKKGKGRSYSKQMGRSKLDSETDFPSLHSFETASLTKPAESLSKPQPGLNISKQTVPSSSVVPNNTPSVLPKVADGGSEALPSNELAPPGLSKAATTVSELIPPKESAPPGLSKAPPGISKALPRSAAPPPGLKSKGPPGFTTSDEKNIQMEKRNTRLLAMLQMYLDDFNMKIFKTLSGEFRRGTKSACAYYDGISELLGGNLKVVLSELVALLPDEDKQQELLLVHNNAKVSMSQQSTDVTDYSSKKTWRNDGAVSNKTDEYVESECGQCGARFPKEQATEHMEKHTESFPALPTAVKKKNHYAFVPVRTSQVKNAWGK